jgi:hypothetical protein
VGPILTIWAAAIEKRFGHSFGFRFDVQRPEATSERIQGEDADLMARLSAPE